LACIGFLVAPTLGASSCQHPHSAEGVASSCVCGPPLLQPAVQGVATPPPPAPPAWATMRTHRRRPAAACRMSYLLPHLRSGYAVDQSILGEEDRVVVIRFGHDYDATCMQMDEILASVAERIKNFAVIYLVDISAVRPQHCRRAHAPAVLHPQCVQLSNPEQRQAAGGSRVGCGGRCGGAGPRRRLRRRSLDCYSPGRPAGARLQHHVRAVRPLHHHVFLPQQAHYD